MDTTAESLRHLPEEIVEEILFRLPVKSLLRFRCVSKSWLSLIYSKRIIKSHLQYSIETKDSSRHRVLIFPFSYYKTKQSKQCPLLALLDGTDLSFVCQPIFPGHIRPVPPDDACCCNGLLCVYQRKHFLLLNPTTRVSKELPKDPEIDHMTRDLQLCKFGFGWDELSGAYKVFAGWKQFWGDWCKFRVYNSKTNSWKAVEDPYLSTCNRGQVGKFVGGKLHWERFITGSATISSFDLRSEVFGKIESPIDTKSGCFLNLGVVGGRLCLSAEFYRKAFDVWVMKESWEKLFTIHLVGEPRYDPGSNWSQVIGEAPNGEILIAVRNSLLVYCPRDDVIRQRIKIGRFFFGAHLCVESLVSPVREITSLDI